MHGAAAAVVEAGAAAAFCFLPRRDLRRHTSKVCLPPLLSSVLSLSRFAPRHCKRTMARFSAIASCRA